MKKEDKYPLICLIIFIAIHFLFLIKPIPLTGWLLENLPFLVILPIIIIVFIYKKLRLSNLSYTLTLIFFAFHLMGVFFGWANVPFTKPLMDIFNLGTNPYDGIVHFMFGLLLYLPVLEAYIKLSKTKIMNWFTYLMPVFILCALGAIYEIYEWIGAIHVDPLLAASFLGTEGDVWDTQKDILFNLLGGLLGCTIFYLKSKLSGKK